MSFKSLSTTSVALTPQKQNVMVVSIMEPECLPPHCFRINITQPRTAIHLARVMDLRLSREGLFYVALSCFLLSIFPLLWCQTIIEMSGKSSLATESLSFVHRQYSNKKMFKHEQNIFV